MITYGYIAKQWGTAAEMDYLKEIGMSMKHSPILDREADTDVQIKTGIKMLKHKIDHLTMYIVNSALRENWEAIDCEKVVNFARAERDRLIKQLGAGDAI